MLNSFNWLLWKDFGMNRIVQNFLELSKISQSCQLQRALDWQSYFYVNLFMFSFQRYFSDDSKVPVLIVGNKADMTAVRQDYILQPEAFCAKHRVLK